LFKIAYHPDYVLPLPERHRFPMIKYELIYQQLQHQGIVSSGDFFEPSLIGDEPVVLAHDPAYWEKTKTLSYSKAEVQRMGFPLSEKLILRERRIAQGTIDGAMFALRDSVSFNIAGGTHHAGADWAEGFCLLNDQAIAANWLLALGKSKKILIIDADVHQGNGTAQIFNNNPKVFTFSIHAKHNFPFTKEKSDLDIGLADQTGDEEYLRIFADALSVLFVREKPDFVFYLSGVDVLASDKLGRLSLSLQACAARDRLVFEQCRKYNLPVQVSMGGGYSSALREIVDSHCNTFKQAIDVFF
jgi:acetoin utilization deacetylase AcuC-like enzyme